MSIDDFLAQLQGVTDDGKGGWMACCPAHDDHNPSMHVNVGADGRILVKCYAGCTTDDICAALGLKVKDLMPERPGRAGAKGKAKTKAKGAKAASAKKSGKAATSAAKVAGPLSAAPKKARDYGKFVCEYHYKREDGATVFKVVRRVMKNGKKTFVQMSPDPDRPGEWRFGVEQHGVEYIPYQVPLIRKAAQGGKSVVICEGEKDVNAIVKRLGLAATCNAKGAGKWSAGFGRFFEGVPSVLIIADKDDETRTDPKSGEEKPFAVGQRHACDVEKKLRADGYLGKIRKVAMPDVEVEQGVWKRVKDFSDWAEAMDAANRKVDKSAFKAAIDEFGEWPDKWNFDGADLFDLQRAQKEARDSAFLMPGEAEDGGEKEDGEKRIDGRGKMEDAGRYGRLCPRAPFKERGWFQVDFQITPGEVARFNVGCDGLQFEGWRRSERDENRGEFEQHASYDEIKCPVSRMVGMAIGCMDSFTRHLKLSNPQRTELTCSLALAWLRARGKFFADADNPMYATSLYFDSAKGVLYNIQSDEFKSFLATETNVSRENKVYDFMMSLIEDMTMAENITPRVRPSKEWDRRDDAIYISNGDSRMYKVTKSGIEDVANGTDGVVFLRGATLLPFKIVDGPGVDPFSASMLFRNASLEKPSDVMNCRLWTLNLFACHRNKPILLVNGPRGSGKTFLLQGIKQFLGIRTDGQLDDSVTKMEHSDKGSDNFWIIIDKGRFEIFDNFDYKIKWADNDLQTASTNGSHKTRELYKTSVLVTQFARACIALTSNNAVFASEGGGLPDRIITARTVGRPKVPKGPGELLADNLANRDKYLTFILRVLAKALADDKPVDSSINMRHPEYAEFSVRCGRAMGCEGEAIRALSTAEIEKAVLPLMNEIIAKEIVAVLVSQTPPGSLSFTAGDMSDRIVKRFGTDEVDEKTRTIYGSRRVGKTIQRLKDDFGTLFNFSSRISEGRTMYDFKGLTPRGEVVLDVLRGGLVDFDGQFSESSPIKEGAGELFENGNANAPNPPYARARSQDVSSAHEREMYEDTESEDIDDLVF